MADSSNPYSSPQADDAPAKGHKGRESTWSGWLCLAWCVGIGFLVPAVGDPSEGGSPSPPFSVMDYCLLGVLIAIGYALAGYAIMQRPPLTRGHAVISLVVLSFMAYGIFFLI